MVSFQVFHSYPGQPQRNGGVFHLYDSNEAPLPSLKEDSGHYRAQEASIAFSHQNQPFQFCGAGAMALAHHLRDQPEAQNTWLPIACGEGSYHFDVGMWRRQPCVRLTPAVAIAQPSELPLLGDGHWFENEKLFAAPMALNTLANFNADNRFLRNLAEKQQSALLYSVNLKQLNIWFRYFTGFNAKGEDQATGSVFRYLHGLLPEQNTVFHVTQLSSRGASMVCEKQAQHMVYWGNVGSLPNAATQPCLSEMHN